MKKNLLFLGLLIFSTSLMAQCDELFISEYVEGYASNKAIEIYNPTNAAIQLSDYSLVRFSNGSTTANSQKVIQLPTAMVEAHDVYVVALDKRDTTLWASDLDKPIWNGYLLIDTLFDSVTGDPILDSLGNITTGPQYLDGSALFGSDYDEEYDLECKGDAYLNPVYGDNNVMYFNGNDAVALIKGSTLATDGSNLLDVIGVIGEDPESTIMEPAWVDENGFWLTRDRTLVRRPEVATGRNTASDIVFSLGGTFTGTEWLSYRKNDFSYLGTHNSACATGTQYDRLSCANGPIASTFEVNQIAFRMYPNPNNTGVLTVEAEEPVQRVEVYNIIGQRVYTEKLSADRLEINTASFNKGMYIVNLIFDDNKLSVQKLVVE